MGRTHPPTNPRPGPAGAGGYIAPKPWLCRTNRPPPPPAAADAAVLQRALDALPATTRSVLWLYHAEGYTHEEIARAMQRSVSFSKSQLARGTRRLRDLLQVEVPTMKKEHAHA